MMFWLGFIAYFLILAVFYAKLEISIEGRFGYAEKLPCRKWRLKGPLRRIIGDRRYLAEYHLWMLIVLLLFFQLPLWFTGWGFWRMELFVLGLFVIFLVLEDFLWFLLNPHYGLRKFKRGLIWWHPNWFLGLPSFYWTALPAGVAMILLSLMCL
jgi:hypothetical protein